MAGGFFQGIRAGLAKTRDKLSHALRAVFAVGRKVDEDLLTELEEVLIAADLGPRLASELVEEVRRQYKLRAIETSGEIVEFLKESLVHSLSASGVELARAPDGPTVILMIGVNGTGKTTTIAKLAHRFRGEGRRVLLAAADTFRAAAVEQLERWAERVGVEIVRHRAGSDPAAVVFDACDAALARRADVLLVDTAGRLHTKNNLMRELEKIRRVAEKKIPGAPHEALLVLDATTGQNALSQAATFAEGVGLTGLVLAKLDGTAKGGIAVAIHRAVRLPIKLIGVGEREGDLAVFDPLAFVDAMFEGVAGPAPRRPTEPPSRSPP
ncbi:MAG: signal recognition particle-docking protein FtsY [Planctomycetota bacterium]